MINEAHAYITVQSINTSGVLCMIYQYTPEKMHNLSSKCNYFLRLVDDFLF